MGPTYYGPISYSNYGYPSYGYGGKRFLYKREAHSNPSGYARAHGGHYDGYYGAYMGPTYFGSISYANYGYPSYGYGGKRRLYKRMSDTDSDAGYDAYGYGYPSYGIAYLYR